MAAQPYKHVGISRNLTPCEKMYRAVNRNTQQVGYLSTDFKLVHWDWQLKAVFKFRCHEQAGQGSSQCNLPHYLRGFSTLKLEFL